MGKFKFSRAGRRKPQDAQPAPVPAMSKAHKILGSTPLSIDAPVYDIAPTLVVNASTFESVAEGEMVSDDGDSLGDKKVNMGESGEEWAGSHGPSSRLHAVGDHAAYGGRKSPAHRLMNNTGSSSTLNSGHDQSEKSQTLPPQTSMSSTAKGLISKAQQCIDLERADRAKVKKKPAKLDFSNIVSGSRPSKKASQSQLHSSSPHNPPRSQSRMSPSPSLSHRQSDLRGLLKRRTKESLRSFLPELSPTNVNEGNKRHTLSDDRLSSLYNHYEQMTFRHVLQEDLESEDSPLAAEGPSFSQWGESPAEQDSDWSQQPRTESRAKNTVRSEYSSSPDQARSVSSRHTRTSGASKQTEKSLQDTDFHDKSVLILSSDSEDEDQSEEEDDDEEYMAPAIAIAKPIVAATKVLPATVKSRPKPSSLARKIPQRISSRRADRRTSFAEADTYITIPSMETNQYPATPIQARADTHYEESPRSISPRPSMVSTNSMCSGMTCQIGYGVDEPSHVTVLTSRRPSQTEIEQSTLGHDIPSQTTEYIPIMSQESIVRASSSDQLTPPLSPSSVDFYVRSGRSSVDEGHRIMALTRQEEMLISALRKKTQEMRARSKMETENAVVPDRRRSRGSNASQATLTESSVFDFDFPVPPTNVSSTQRNSGDSVVYAPNAEYPQNDSQQEGIPSGSLRATVENSSLDSASEGSSQESTEHQDVFVFLDQGTATSDWGHGSQEDEPIPILPAFQPISWNSPETKQLRHQKDNELHKSNRMPALLTDSLPRIATRRLATLAEHGVEDIPRPDSPISPASFPIIPEPKSTVHNTARLSAVGYVRKKAEPGWWGDDD